MIASVEESSSRPPLLSVLETQVLGSSVEASLDLDNVSVSLAGRGMFHGPLFQGLVVRGSRGFHDFSKQLSFGDSEQEVLHHFRASDGVPCLSGEFFKLRNVAVHVGWVGFQLLELGPGSDFSLAVHELLFELVEELVPYHRDVVVCWV